MLSGKMYEELSIKGDVMNGASTGFDESLQKLFKNMSKSGSDEGSITLKIDVKIEPIEVTDDDGNPKMVSSPILKHTISTQVPVKNSVGGSTNTEMALIYDEELQRYVLKRAQKDGQMSIYDVMDNEEKEVAGELPGPSNVVDMNEIPAIGMNEPEDPEDEDDSDYRYDEPED